MFRIALRRMLTVVLLAAVFIGIKAAWSVFEKERETREKALAAETQLKELEERERLLREEVAYRASERGLEDTLRTEYALAREGERLMVIIDESSYPTTTSLAPTEKKRDWWPW
jgi:predicted Holliday junction resolvase-like endonuclease